MDIELRNALGALTAQVQDLTKHSKVLDGTLATALDKGAKSAGGLADRARSARQELGLAGDISQKLSAAWGRQMLQLAVGATSITALWQQVSSAMDRANQRSVASGKATADYASSTRLPGDNPAMRRALRESAPLLTPDEQAAALKAYRKAGGSGDAADISALGGLLDQAQVSGIDTTAAATQFARLRKAGVSPTAAIDAISRASLEATELDKMKPGAARAYASAPATMGAFGRMKSATKIEEIDQLELQLRAIRARKESGGATSVEALKAAIRKEIGESDRAGTPGAALPLIAGDVETAKASADNLDALRAEARKNLSRFSLFAPTDAAVEREALRMQAMRRDLPSVTGALPAVQRTVITGDERPVPVNAGD